MQLAFRWFVTLITAFICFFLLYPLFFTTPDPGAVTMLVGEGGIQEYRNIGLLFLAGPLGITLALFIVSIAQPLRFTSIIWAVWLCLFAFFSLNTWPGIIFIISIGLAVFFAIRMKTNPKLPSTRM